MAENDNTGTAAPGEDPVVAIATALLEARIALEAAVAGLQRLANDYAAIAPELGVIVKFASQAAEAFEALAKKLAEILPLRGLDA